MTLKNFLKIKIWYFGLIGDLLDGVARLTGSILAIPVAVVAKALDITVSMVEEAKDAGLVKHMKKSENIGNFN